MPGGLAAKTAQRNPCRLERPPDRRVAPVDVVTELRAALRVGEGRAVDQMNGHLLFKDDTLGRTGPQACFEEADRIVFLHRQKRMGKFMRVVEPDAAMRKGPHGPREEVLRRCVVKIDVVAVREHELHRAQRILRARWLAHGEREGRRAVLREAPAAVHLPPIAIRDLEMADRVRVAAQHRQVFVHDDRARDIPARIDLHVLHHVRELGRLPVRILGADHRAGLEGELVVVIDPCVVIGEVHLDVTLAEPAGHVDPALALHRDDDRFQAVIDALVDRIERLRAGDPVDGLAEIGLHVAHGLFHRRIVDRGRGMPQISHRHEAVPQIDDGLPAHAGLELGRAHRRAPAAARALLFELHACRHQAHVFRALRCQ